MFGHLDPDSTTAPRSILLAFVRLRSSQWPLFRRVNHDLAGCQRKRRTSEIHQCGINPCCFGLTAGIIRRGTEYFKDESSEDQAGMPPTPGTARDWVSADSSMQGHKA